MRRWKVVACLTVGAMYLLACDEQAQVKPITLVDDNPLLGTWYLQSVGEQTPVAIGTTVRFVFEEHGSALYERTHGPSDELVRYELAYNVAQDLISIDSDSEDPGVPRVTGKIELDDEAGTLLIKTHSDERWLLTREDKPGGELEARRAIDQPASRVDPMLLRVQKLAYACGQYAGDRGQKPEQIGDLITARLVAPQELTAEGSVDALPPRYERMTDAQRNAWFSGNSPFVFFFEQAGEAGHNRVVVATLPVRGDARVWVGMSNGAVHEKRAEDLSRLLHKQRSALPDRWPKQARPTGAVSGLEPLSD